MEGGPVIPAAAASASIPGRSRRRHYLEALPHQRPVEAYERRHVRHRRQRHEVEEADEVRPLGALGPHQPVDRHEHQEDHRRRAEVAEGPVFVLPVRVHHRERRRQGLGPDVMVEHDDVAARRRDGLVAQRPAVDADDEVVARPERLHRRHVRPVALLDPVRHVEGGARPSARSQARMSAAAGPAVHVVVGEDRDPLERPSPPPGTAPPPGPCRGAATGRASDRAGQGRGTPPPRRAAPRAAPGCARRSRAARWPGRWPAQPVVLLGGPHPAPAGDGGLDVEEGGRSSMAKVMPARRPCRNDVDARPPRPRLAEKGGPTHARLRDPRRRSRKRHGDRPPLRRRGLCARALRPPRRRDGGRRGGFPPRAATPAT